MRRLRIQRLGAALGIGVVLGVSSCHLPTVPLPYGCYSDRHAIVHCYHQGGGNS